MSVSKQAMRNFAAVSVCLMAAGFLTLSGASCNSLEVPETNTAVQATRAVEAVQPRLSESTLANHGLEEIWYLGEIPAHRGSADIQAAYLLKDGLFVVTKPAKPKAKKHLIRFHRPSGEAIWYEDLPGTPEFRPFAFHYPPEAGRDPELFYSYLDEVTCLDLDTGRKMWSRNLSIPISTPIVANEKMLFAGSDLKICFAVKKKSKVEAWTYRTNGRIESAPVLVGSNVIFASHDGHVMGLIPSKGYDTIRSWDFATGARVRANIGTFDRWIFVGSEDYKLYCLRLDGSVQWSYVAEARIVDEPIVFRVRPNKAFVYIISDRDSLRGSPRTLQAIPLPRGDFAGGAYPIWRVANVRKIVSIGLRNLYVLMEPGASGQRVLVALDLETGKESFRIDLEGWNFVPTNYADGGRHKIERGRIYLISESGAIQVIGEKLQ
jgi:outer membrane protein assembly factor BamB